MQTFAHKGKAICPSEHAPRVRQQTPKSALSAGWRGMRSLVSCYFRISSAKLRLRSGYALRPTCQNRGLAAGNASHDAPANHPHSAEKTGPQHQQGRRFRHWRRSRVRTDPRHARAVVDVHNVRSKVVAAVPAAALDEAVERDSGEGDIEIKRTVVMCAPSRAGIAEEIVEGAPSRGHPLSQRRDERPLSSTEN